MRRSLTVRMAFCVAAAVVVVWSSQWAAGNEEKRELNLLLKKILTASAGSGTQKLDQVKAFTLKQIQTSGSEKIYLSVSVRWPYNIRVELRQEEKAKESIEIFVINRDKSWDKVGDTLRETSNAFDANDVGTYGRYVGMRFAGLYSVLPALLLKDPEFIVADHTETKVGNDPASRITLRAQQTPDLTVRLFVNRETYLPVKVEVLFQGSIVFEIQYSNYEKISGILIPRKSTGRVLGEDEWYEKVVSDFRLVSELDNKLFEKP